MDELSAKSAGSGPLEWPGPGKVFQLAPLDQTGRTTEVLR
jgi:hypothetical protein